MNPPDELPFLPESADEVKDDLVAGFSVAALALPQNMAYALIAGLDPIYGLYTSIVAMVVGAVVGPSRYLIVGPTNMMALAVASSLAGVEIDYFQAVLLFTFMVGAFQLLLVVLRLGELVNYVSRSVINGLTSGVALLIIVGQLGSFTGIDHPSGFNIIMDIYYFAGSLEEANIYAFMIGVMTIAIIVFKKIAPFSFPGYLISMIAAVAISMVLGWHEQVEVVEHFPGGLPAFTPFTPRPGFMFNYAPAALSVAVLGFIHAMGPLKSMETHTGEEVDFNRAFFSQSIVNMACSFFSGFAVSGSFTKSFANLQAGAKSSLSEIFAALTIVLFITIFRPVGEYIPIAALSGLVIMVAVKMVDFEEIKDSFRNRFDALIFASTFLMTILSPRLDYAIYFGVLVSFVLILKNTSSINYSHFDYHQRESEFFKKDLDDVKENDYIVINLSGNINFNASESLKEELDESYQDEQKFIIRMRDVENLDLTSLRELEDFIDRVQDHEGAVIVCGVDDNLEKMFERYDLDDKVGEQCLFPADDHIFSATEAAIDKAEDIDLPYDVDEDAPAESEGDDELDEEKQE